MIKHFEYIREFRALAEEGDSTRAARRLGLSQSALSKHIKQMELNYGVPFFDRTAEGTRLNRYGEIFLRYAKKVEREQALFFRELRQQGQEAVRIGYISSLPQSILDLFFQFMRENPEIQLSMEKRISDRIEEGLTAGELDFGFFDEAAGVERRDAFHRIPLEKDVMVAVLPAGHPLAGAEAVSLRELAGERFIMWPKESRYYKILHPYFMELDMTPEVVAYVPVGEHILNMVSQGYGVAVLSRRRSLFQQVNNVALVDLDPPVPICLNMVCRDAFLSGNARRFLSFVVSQTNGGV